MDKLKDFLKQAVKYRFWIASGLSVLLPLIGYLVASGSINDKTKKATETITSADKGVQTYLQPGLPNAQYPPLVNDKKAVLATDVEKAWDKLYARQAPLLKWPEIVEERFHTWGRKWPEDVDKGAVQAAIGDYVLAYDKSVEETFKKVKPWDPMEGTGIVVVPDKMVLLRPAVFDVAKPPDLGKVWASQERLWIQGTLLDAIAKINGAAKDWDGAIVKQISAMEVGSPIAQDQKSIAKGDTVEAAPSLTPDADAAAPAPAAETNDPMSAMMSAMGGMGRGGAATATEDVYYLKTESTAYKILPVQMTVLVDQNRLQDFFIGLENSPMAIQVMEFELQKPLAPVVKPVKGEMNSMFGGGMYEGGSGMASMNSMMMMNRGMAGGRGDGVGDMGGSMMRSAGMMGMYGGTGTAPAAKTGVDVRSKNAKKDRDEKADKRKKMNRAVDMYFDIVQVTVYGQARFYNPPPPPPPGSDSTASAAPATPVDPKTDEAAKPTAAADPGAPATPKADEPKSGDPGAPAAPKTDPKPADAPQAETKPVDAPAPKADAKPAEATPKPEAKSTDTPKR